MSAEEIKKQLESLVRKCRYEKLSITQLEKYDLKDLNRFQITVFLEQLEKAYIEFRKTDELICEIDPSQSRIEELNKIYIKLKSNFLKALNKLEPAPIVKTTQEQFNETLAQLSEHQRELIETIKEQSISAASASKDKIKLPPIDIPLFWGKNAEEFQSFNDLFTSIVHNNTSLSNSQKLSYLKRFLKGDAYTLIRHVLVTDANYEDTWRKVVKRYDNPAQIVTAFTKKFIDQPTVSQHSTQSLRRLCDVSSEVIAGLHALGPEAETRDVWLNYLILTKLDADSRNEWAKETVEVKYPTLKLLLDFLEKRCTALENCEATQKRQNPKPSQNLKTFHAVTSSSSSQLSKASSMDSATSILSTHKSLNCRKCSGEHRLSDCDDYNALDLVKRKEYIAAARVCFNCLGSGHNSKTCASRRRCFVCHRKHHTTLHSPDSFQSSSLQANVAETSSQGTADEPSCIVSNISLFSSPLLPTASIKVLNSEGHLVQCRILFDSGSNGSLISESCVQRLGLQRSNARYPVTGIASKAITQGSTHITISPHFDEKLQINMKVFIMDHIASNLPKIDSNILLEWDVLNSITLADPINELKTTNHEVDIVMGVGYFLRILREGQHEGPNELICQNTTFGWIISGGNIFVPEQNSYNVQVNINADVLCKNLKSLSDKSYEQPFSTTHCRTEDGRIIVNLPFVHKSLPHENSLSQAASQFLPIERKLQANKEFIAEYANFITEYREVNHMEALTADVLKSPPTQHYDLPHHTVALKKSIVSPIKSVTIHLELGAAHLLIKLAMIVIKTLRLRSTPSFSYCGSTNLMPTELINLTLWWYWLKSDKQMWSIRSLSTWKEDNLSQEITTSRNRALSPHLDDKNALRVGDRLKNAPCSYSAKHPIILPKGHTLSKSILTYLHLKYLHPTSSTLFHISRQSYWIVNGRVLVRQITNACLLCFKTRSKPVPQLMGNLPAVRVTPARPFSNVGVDFAGPFQIANKKGRGARMTKAYVAVFVCMVVKAVHLELVSDLSTEAFLAALRRFSSRRGAPSNIYSDNGTNFKGACNKLSEFQVLLNRADQKDIIVSQLATNGIRWHFTPPASPSMGGLWEASVKCMKHHLYRATANANLTFEEHSTLLCQIEAILNSRPLTKMSSNPQDENPLTPAHFLLLEPLGAVPDEDVLQLPDNRLNRWQNIQKRIQCFWKRFSKEYLHTLQQRTKWTIADNNIIVNDLVYITNENTSPFNWPIGRVIATHEGSDNIVRVVTVRTGQNTLKRPVTKLVKLPIFNSNEED